jgi:hypothetical protein
MAGLKVRQVIEDTTADVRRHTHRGVTNYDAEVPITHCWEVLCRWVTTWTDHELWAPTALETPTVVITSDASEFGHASHTLPRTWSHRGHFTAAERKHHHNEQENWAGNRGTVAFSEETGFKGEVCLALGVIIPKCITREQDNVAVLKAVRARMVKSVALCQATERHENYKDMRGLQELGSFISGRTMDNLRDADRGSRETSTWPRWMLEPRVVAQICREKGWYPSRAIDLFTEEASRQFPRMVTEAWNPHALWKDAMTRGWHHQDNPLLTPTDWLWAFPPPVMLKRIAARLTAAGSRTQPMLLVVPNTPSATWWQQLRPLMQGEPVSAGPMGNLVPPEGAHDCDRTQRPPKWQLCVLQLGAATPTAKGGH